MSLIADALKRAQEQRKTGQGEDRARRMLTGPGPLRVESRDGPVLTRPLALAVAAVMVGAVVLAAAIVTTPTAEAPPRTGVAGLRAEDPVDGGTRGRLVGSGDREWGDEGAVLEAGGELALRAGVGPRASEGGRYAGRRSEGPSAGSGSPGDRSSGAGGGMRPRAETSSGAGAGTGAGTRTGAGTGSEGRDSEAASYPEDGGVRLTGPAQRAGAVADDRRGGYAVGEESSFRITVSGGERQRTAEQYFSAALGAHRAGDLERAVTLYRSALELRPADPEFWNNLGTVYRGLAMPEEAMAAFRSAVEAEPSYAPAWSNLGLVLDAAGRDGEAIEAFREALRRDPGNAGAKVNLANKYQALGMREEARSLLREVVRDDPSLPEAHYGLARVLEDEGAAAEARRHYRLFLELGRGRFPELEARVLAHLVDLSAGGS